MHRRGAFLLCVLIHGAALADDAPCATASLRWETRRDNTEAGPIAAARAISPGIVPATPGTLRLAAEVAGTARPLSGLTLSGNALLAHERPGSAPGRDASRINEAYAAFARDDWQLLAGRRVLGWDVGYAFRPNDVVQQEQRRTLLSETPEGRPIVQFERLLPDAAWSVVWTQPQHGRDDIDRSHGARESAFALQLYQRAGALDLYGFGRIGRRTGASIGAAVAWVPIDSLELHGSWRAMQRHVRWQAQESALIASGNPWRESMAGGASMGLIGGQWTVGRWNLLAEAWHDGTALDDAQWQIWQDRNLALQRAFEQGAPALPVAANLAWQASPLQASSLRRRNLFVRAAWQRDALTAALDLLTAPQDHGRIVTASLQWKGDRAAVTVAWRRYGGPASALSAQLPSRAAGALLWSWAL